MRTLSHSLTSEFAFVLSSSGTTLGEVCANLVNDWHHVTQLALEHRVLPRVWRNAGALIPPPHAQVMHEYAVQNSRNALHHLHRTIEAVQLLEWQGIDVIVLKGPLLAQRLYGDFGLRMCSDVDLLVHPQGLERATRLLSDAGYAHHTALDRRALKRHRKVEHDVAFMHPDDGTLIEIHADIAQPHYSYRVDVETWWANRETVQIAGHRLTVLKAEHAYLLSVLHAAKHHWSRLDLICDVATFHRIGLDRDLIRRQADAAGVTRLLDISEALASHFYANPVSCVDDLANEVIPDLIGAKNRDRWQEVWLDVRGRERVGDRIRYLVRRLVRRPFMKMALGA